MSKRENTLLLDDIWQSINKIYQYTTNINEDIFLTDEKTQDAVCRNFSIIGEAASRLTEDFKAHYTQINWRIIKDFRNKIIHDYIGTDYREVWKIIQQGLPTLKHQIESILASI